MTTRLTRWLTTLDNFEAKMAQLPAVRRYGRLTRATGLVLEATGLQLPLGATCVIERQNGSETHEVESEVVGFNGQRLFLMPLEEVEGVLPGARVYAKNISAEGLQSGKQLPLGPALLGRVLDGSGKWTDESFVKAASLLQEMADEKLVPDGYAGMTPEEAVEQFKSGKAASFIWSSYCISNFEADDSAVKDKVVLAKCPTVEGGKGDENNWLGQADRCLVVSERCENKDAAVEFIKFYTQTKYMQKMADAGTLTTINAEKLDLSNVGPIASQIMKLHSDMTGLFVFYDVALGSVVGNEYNNTVQGIMAGNDPQEAFENFQQFFDENYEK